MIKQLVDYRDDKETDKYEKTVEEVAIEIKQLQDTVYEKDKSKKRQDVIGIIDRLYCKKLYNDMTAIECSNITFRYEDDIVLENASIIVKKGKLAGEFAFGGAGKQAELLMADGIEVVNGRVDLDKYGMKM